MSKKIKAYKVVLYKTFVLRKLRYEWRWRVTASNGNIIGAATESYVNKLDAEYNIKSLGKSLVEYE